MAYLNGNRFLMNKFYILVSLLAFSFFNLSAQCDGRCEQEIFSQVTVTQGVPYGSADGQTLFMDIYQPTGDTATNRPVVIMCFGGAFIGGERTSGELVLICEDLAKKGYVTASIDYRLESPLNVIFEENMVKAVLRATQDGKAAVRFFRKEAANGNAYGIDSSTIFIGGTSAGGILGMHVAYLNDSTLLSPNWLQWSNDIGGIEGNSGNPGYSSRVSGVVGFAAALGDSAWLKTANIPFMSVHAEDDGTVPYNIGFPLGLATLPNLYGSNVLAHRADILGIHNPFYSYTGDNHPPFAGDNGLIPGVMDSTIDRMTRFLYRVLPCTPAVGIADLTFEENEISVYPNPVVNGMLNIQSFNSEADHVRLYSIDGAQIDELGFSGSEQLDMSGLSAGWYIVEVSASNTGQVLRKKIWKP